MKSKYFWASKSGVLGRIEPILHIIILNNNNTSSLCGERSRFGFKEPELLSGMIVCEDCFAQVDDSPDFHMIKQFRINHGF